MSLFFSFLSFLLCVYVERAGQNFLPIFGRNNEDLSLSLCSLVYFQVRVSCAGRGGDGISCLLNSRQCTMLTVVFFFFSCVLPNQEQCRDKIFQASVT